MLFSDIELLQFGAKLLLHQRKPLYIILVFFSES